MNRTPHREEDTMMEPNNLVGGARIRVMFVVALCLLCSLANAASEYRPPAKVPPVGIGFRGDGGGYFPDAKIPVEFGDEKNLLWKAPLVNWSWSSPVPVGNRVLMMAEPTWSGALWPQLCCYDADTGERLWVVDVNPLDAFPDMPADVREAITEDFKWWYGWHNELHKLTRPFIDAGGVPADDPRMKEINAKLAPLGGCAQVRPGGAQEHPGPTARSTCSRPAAGRTMTACGRSLPKTRKEDLNGRS